jgi:uncharacterized repeat protein (TIGR01451 family)
MGSAVVWVTFARAGVRLMRDVVPSRKTLQALAWGAAICLALVVAASPAMGQVVAGYSEYFIPADEDDLSVALCTHGATACASPNTHAVISVTAWSDNTSVYFDHWENGYNFDPANPTTADETYAGATALNTGDRLVFESSNIALPRWNTYPTPPPSPPTTTCGYTATLYRAGGSSTVIRSGTGTTCYEGGDRIYTAGGAVTVARVGWNEARGVGVQGAAWEIYPVKPQLTTYILPIGENVPAGENAGTTWYGFQRVAALIQATADNTTVTVDLNGDGVPDLININRNATKSLADGDSTTITLNRGETFLLDQVSACTTNLTTCTTNPGTLNSGTVIQGSSTLQVKYIAGRTNVNYCTRGFSAFPRGFWTTDYYAPLDQPTSTANGITDYYLYNPNSSAITVNWEGLGVSGSFSIPALTSRSFTSLAGTNVPAGSGLYFKGSDIFWGVGVNDSRDYAHEWGFSLLPSTMLFREHFLGWAPDAYPVAVRSDMGAFLSVAQDNTTVFVDYDNNGTVDQTYTLNRLQTQYVVNPTTGDLSGTHFWATGPFTLAYGQNGNFASTTAPALDLGYVAIPGTDFMSLVLGVTKSVSPQVVPTTSGSTAIFTITVTSEKYTVDGVNVTDYMPPNWQYVPGTTTITRPDKTTLTAAAADPTVTGVPASGQTLAWSAAQVGNPSPPSMLKNQVITITFTGQTTAAFSAGALSENRVTAVGTRTLGGVTQTFTAKNFAYVTYGNVGISKTSSVPAATPLYPGDPVTYTTQVTNPSAPTITGVSLYDPIPPGISYVPGSGQVTCERAQNVRDEFSTVAYTNNDGSASWSGAWTETDAYGTGPGGTGAGAAGGFAAISGGQLQLRYLLSTVGDEFNAQAYNLNTGSDNWSTSWTEVSDDGSASTVGNQHIYIDGGRLWLDHATGNTFGIYRDANIPTGSSVTISFVPTDEGIDAGEAVVAEYSSNGGASYTTLQTFDGGTAGWSGNTQTYNIASFPGTVIRLRFRATDAWNQNNDEMTIDDVLISYNSPTSAVGTQVQRTASVPGGSTPSLSFSYAATGLVATDHVVVEASSSATGPFTTLAVFNGGTPSVAPPYDLTPYISAATTIRLSVTGGYAAAGKTLFFDNVDISYTAVGTFASGSPPNFLPASAGCQIRPGGTPVTLTFNATVDNPLASGITSITNTASTTSTQFPIALSASVTNIVANPSVLSASVAGRVWFDADGDTVQDIGEPGIANVEVTLKDRFGTPIATTITDATGRYLFSGVEPGTGYYVEVTDSLPSGLTQTTPAGHADNQTNVFDLAAGQDYGGADLGYRSAPGLATFGDVVWVDANNNGTRDAGEIGLGGVSVQLWQDANSNGIIDAGDTPYPTSPITTAPDGSYLFTGVTASGTEDYIVAVVTPSGYTATTDTALPYLDVASGSVILTADFGFRSLSGSFTIQDQVWRDTNGNGLLDGGEVGIAGITVTLLDASLQVIGTTTTAADGTFVFSGVPGGGADYTVRISDTAGLLTDYVGTTSYAIARERAESNLTANVDHLAAPSYGFRPTRAIGDTIFRDVNGNGVQDPGDGGFSGISVSLYQDSNGNGRIDGGEPLVGTVTTDANGQYLFAGLTNGSYVVSVPAAPAGYTFTGPGSDSDPVTAGIQKPAVMSGANVLDVDYGYQAATPRTLAGVVWIDDNADGVIGSGESRLVGVTLDVYSDLDGDGVIDAGEPIVSTVTTDAAGAYSVAGLAAGAYVVKVTDTSGVLTGYAPTYEKTEGLVGPFNYQEAVDLSSGDVTDVNFGYGRPRLTYATVASLRAYHASGSVVVEWRTSTEVGTLGFHLYRLDPASRGWLRLDEKLIPGLVVHPQGGTYRFLDRTAPATETLTYALVEKDVHGDERGYGPYAVRVAASAPASFADAKADLGRAGFSRRPTPLSGARLAAATDVARTRRAVILGRAVRRTGVLKVTTQEEGLHYISAAQLAAASGLALDYVTRLVRSSKVKLTSRQRMVPWLPDASGDGVFFLADASNLVYTADEVFRLGFESSRPIAAVASVPSGVLATSFPETVHREEDAYPIPVYVQNPAADFWAWDYLFAGYDGLDTKTLTVSAPAVAGVGAARLVVHLLGGSDSGIADEHHVAVSLNGTPLGDVVWHGIAWKDAEFVLSASDVREGDNTVELKAILGPGIRESIVFLDSVDLGYERLYRAEGDQLAFSAPAFAGVEVSGFTNADVLLFDVTTPGTPALVSGASVVPAGDGTFTLEFGVGRADGGRYLAVARAQAKSPAAVGTWQRSNLLDPANRADYVLVAPDMLKDAAQVLADYRTSRGIGTKVISLEEIYDTFDDGFPEPVAIREFLRYARSHWSSPPRYAALVGRGTWDYWDRMGAGDNLVPPLLAGTPNGLVASDVALGDLSGDDGIPEIAIGRIPVLTSQQLLDYVAKIEAYEGAPGDAWQYSVLMAADNPDAAGAFPTDSDDVAAIVPPDHVVDKVYLTSYTPAEAHQAIRDTLDAGVAVFNYIGHGSPNQLADEGILTNSDVGLLANADRLGVFLAMTCSVGNFAIPGYPSLGELMVLKRDGGAYAVWAPSGLSENDLAVRLDKGFFKARFVDGETVVGDLVTRGLGELTVPGSMPHRFMYNLLGEPVDRMPSVR